MCAQAFILALLGLPSARRAECEARVEAHAILARFGLSERAGDPAATLAYGLQRRVEIARAVAGRPTLLLLDEPAAGLNGQETHALGGLLRDIAEDGPTMLLIEHHMDLVMSVSKHVLVLDYGEKIAEGSPKAIRGDPKVVAAYLGAEEDVSQPRVMAAG